MLSPDSDRGDRTAPRRVIPGHETWRACVERLYGAGGVEQFDKATPEGAQATPAADEAIQQLGAAPEEVERSIVDHVRRSYGWHGGMGDLPPDDVVLAIVRATLEYLDSE